MFSKAFEVTLNSAFARARAKRHEFMTVEHLLLALLENPSAAAVLRACNADTGKLGKDTQALTGAATPTTFYTAKRYNAAVGYKAGAINLGAEYFYAKDYNNVTVNPATNALSQDSARGLSVFGNYNFTPKWSIFGRYDYVQPNYITDNALHDHYLNVGLQWEPVKIVDITLAYKREVVEGGAISTSNGVIGCTTSATAASFATVAAATAADCGASNGTYDEVGLFGQIKF